MNPVALAKEIRDIKNEEVLKENTDDIIELENGKYTLKLTNNGDRFKCERYGQPWRNLIGDNMVLSMFYEILRLREENQRIIEGASKAITSLTYPHIDEEVI